MSSSKISVCWRLPAVVFLSAMLTPVAAKGPKMKSEELVARHLAALGSPEARSVVQSRGAQGTGRLELLAGGSGSLEGPVVLASHWAVRANRWPPFR